MPSSHSERGTLASDGNRSTISPQSSAASVSKVQLALTLRENKGEVKWMIQYESIQIKEEVGRGSFGVVYRGIWRNAAVAGSSPIFFSDLMLKSSN